MINLTTKVFFPSDKSQLPSNTFFPHQTHSNRIIEIKTGKENLNNCDGLISSRNNNYFLGVVTADCAPISFYDDHYYGIIHVGWRGLINGIVEQMVSKFNSPTIFIGPLLEEFEIQPDDCYQQLSSQFNQRFFYHHQGKLIFKFKLALQSLLPKNKITFDIRNTFTEKNLASWRRDHRRHYNNFTVIGIF